MRPRTRSGKKSVDAGIRTQEEYDKWRLQAIAGGERWEKMKARIVADQLHTNQIAREIMNKEMPGIFELNANFALYQVEHDSQIDTSLTLYNREAVDRILRDDPEMLLPPGQKVSEQIRQGKAERWERNKVQSVMTQGILQGESIPKLASRLASAVADSDYKAAVRNARTMATNAQNAGRYDAYNRLESNGVELTLEWAATLDNRTRHEHRMMHGQRRNVGEPFEVSGVKIMYPAQTGSFMSIENAPQELIWNCRCTILAFVKGYEHDTITHSDKMGKMTFEEWLEAKPKSQNILHQAQRGDQIEQEYINEYRKMSKEADEILKNRSTVVNGQDIFTTWKRRKDQFDFEIEDVINAQGFDGKPRVMSRAEFEEAVKAANGGNGFIAQRTYSAPDQETLDAYRDQLYNGKWYVDCSTGGAAYGKGMYSVYSNGTSITDYMKREMNGYSARRGIDFNYVETFTLDPSAKTITPNEIFELRQKKQKEIMDGLKARGGWKSEEAIKWAEKMGENLSLDDGSIAAALGYDAIITSGIDDYAVILNRTKVIFLRED